jgi:hypothetical protein
MLRTLDVRSATSRPCALYNFKVDEEGDTSVKDRPFARRLKPVSFGARRSKPDLIGVMPDAIFVES